MADFGSRNLKWIIQFDVSSVSVDRQRQSRISEILKLIEIKLEIGIEIKIEIDSRIFCGLLEHARNSKRSLH